VIVTGVLTALAVVAPSASAMPGRMVKVASGHWNGEAWTLEVRDQVSGGNVAICYRMSSGTEGLGGSCGNFILPRLAGAPEFGMTLADKIGGCPGTDYVVGPVVAKASGVDVTLSNGQTVRTRTIAPPAGLAQAIGFYVARIPCGTQPTGAVGLSSARTIVARFSGS